MVRQVTIRGVGDDLARRLKETARARGESVNATILRLLEQALGVDARRERLKRYATWTDADFDEFEAALRAQRTIDEKLWR